MHTVQVHADTCPTYWSCTVFWYMSTAPSDRLERSNNMPKISMLLFVRILIQTRVLALVKCSLAQPEWAETQLSERSKDGWNLLTWKPESSLWWWGWTVMEAQMRSHLITFYSVFVHPCHCWPSHSNEKVSGAWLKENKLDGRKGRIKPRCEPWMSG